MVAELRTKHVPVLLNEAIDHLKLEPGQVFVDGTLGAGGHSAEVARRFGNQVQIIGLDRDAEAVARADERVRKLAPNMRAHKGSFEQIGEILQEAGFDKADAVLLDLGISSDQLESSHRGFSFQRDEPLDMRMDVKSPLTAELILNSWEEDTLELILRGFGEERFARKIAREIVTRREERPFRTTFDLVEAVRAATPTFYQRGKLHPATKTFQALRIAVNGELTALENGLRKSFEVLNPDGRLAVISFHSLEDRLVKNSFREWVKQGAGKLVNKKPLVPSTEEVAVNPRARSAKLRVLEKV